MAKVPSSGFTVSLSRLAQTLDIAPDKIKALADAGYLCTTKGKFGQRLIVKVSPPERLPPRVVDRISVALWLLGLDKGRYQPCFSQSIETEIMRIARLKEPMRTEQSIRMILRYRDAEELVATLAKARAGDVASVRIKSLSHGYKVRMARLAGITDQSDQIQSQADRQIHPLSSEQSPSAARSGLARKPRRAASQ